MNYPPEQLDNVPLATRIAMYKEVFNSLNRLAACALIGDWFVNI
jgi:hypothetical protein